MKLLITDLDNTLYDWVTFFSKSFKAMVEKLSSSINVKQDQLLSEFKTIHQKYGNTEQPFAILELPSVRKQFGNLPELELMRKLDDALHAFNSVRKRNLNLYNTVRETLSFLKESGVSIVGYTEAIAVNGYYRLYKLEILDYFKKLYALEGRYNGHPDSSVEKRLTPPDHFIETIPNSYKKPNPVLLHNICKKEGVSPGNAWYVGDSLVKDISMAKDAGITSIWAKYGTDYDKELWKTLVKVTHWTDEDAQKEVELKKRFANIKPDYIINSFDEIIPILNGEKKYAA